MDNMTELEYIPVEIVRKLMPFQREGVKFALSRDGICIFGDEMGLGKTLQALATACHYRHQNEWPLLIVAPTTLKYQWVDEIEKWLPDVSPHDIHVIKNKDDVGDINKAQITIVTYGMLRQSRSEFLREALQNKKFNVVIVDESHSIKNRKSATYIQLLPLIRGARRRLLLTGTPATNRPAELYSQLDALHPNLWGTWTTFTKRYCNARFTRFGGFQKWDVSGASNLEELQRLLVERCMIRRLKKDVLTELPPKVRTKITFDIKESDQKKDVEASRKRLDDVMRVGRQSMETLVSNPEEIPNTSLQLKQAITEMQRSTCIAKIGPVREYITLLLENEVLKMIVFSHHHAMTDGIVDLLNKSNIKFIVIDGRVMTEDRPHRVSSFQNDPDVRVAVLGMKAAGTGLNLTAATQVVFAELDWTPGNMQQCEDRAHRIGQQSSVQIHYLVAKGTLDEWLYSCLQKKTSVLSSTLDGASRSMDMALVSSGDGAKVLSNAEAWEAKESSVNVEDLFVSNTPLNQKTMLQFFTPKNSASPSCSRSSHASPVTPATSQQSRVSSHKKSSVSSLSTPPSCKRKRLEYYSPDSGSESEADDVITIGSSPEAADSTTPPDTDAKTSNWPCSDCTFLNHEELQRCEICDSPRVKRCRANVECQPGSPSRHHPARLDGSIMDDLSRQEDNNETLPLPVCEPQSQESTFLADIETARMQRGLDVASIPVYPLFQYCSSKYTDKIFLYCDGSPLNANFVPEAVLLANVDTLPDVLLHHDNYKLVRRFCREWLSLSDLQRRAIANKGLIFTSPTLAYGESRAKRTTKRFVTKSDVEARARAQAESTSGTVREVCSGTGAEPGEAGVRLLSPGSEARRLRTIQQAYDDQDRPLCIQCSQPFDMSLVSMETMKENAWRMRLCSQACRVEYWTKSSGTYIRETVFRTQRGVCQMCGLETEDIFQKLQNTKDLKEREKIVNESPYRVLNVETKRKMVQDPKRGQFWHADHIEPVASGGGQCDLGNMRTLCTPCHGKVTQEQAKMRTIQKRGAKNLSIKNFFKKT